MSTTAELGTKVEAARRRLLKARQELEAAHKAEPEAAAAYDTAVRRCYLEELPKTEEERARATWTETKLNVERLERVIPMLAAELDVIEQELHSERWAEALNLVAALEPKLAALAEQICDKDLEIAALGAQMRRLVQEAKSNCELLKRPLPEPRGYVHEARKARAEARAKHGEQQLIVY